MAEAPRFQHGLVIGTFLPPHSGHAALIADAAARCERVTVLVMGSQLESHTPEARAGWLSTWARREGLATVQVIPVMDDAPDDCSSDTAWLAHTEIIRRALSTRGIPAPDVCLSAEPYISRLARELGAQHLRVLRTESDAAISATRIRSDVVGRWKEVLPEAREELAVRIVVVGAESTGTTTLCRALTAHFGARFPGLEFVPEWGREYTYIKHAELVKTQPDATAEDIVWTPEDFEDIAREQNRLENAAALACPLVIADTDAWATTLWERRYLGEESHASREEGGRVGPRAVYLVTDHVGVPFEDDGWRDGELIRADMTEWFLRGLALSEHSWVRLRGTREERLEYSVRLIDALLETQLAFETTPWKIPHEALATSGPGSAAAEGRACDDGHCEQPIQ